MTDAWTIMRRGRAWLALAYAVVTALACAGLCVAGIVARAPAAVVPLLAVCCVGAPMLAAWDLPTAIHSLRVTGRRGAVAEFRRSLRRLPEAPHPHGW